MYNPGRSSARSAETTLGSWEGHRCSLGWPVSETRSSDQIYQFPPEELSHVRLRRQALQVFRTLSDREHFSQHHENSALSFSWPHCCTTHVCLAFGRCDTQKNSRMSARHGASESNGAIGMPSTRQFLYWAIDKPPSFATLCAPNALTKIHFQSSSFRRSRVPCKLRLP